MPGISVDGKRWPSVSTEVFGARTASGSEVTLMITRDDSVQIGEHALLVEYARECLLDMKMNLAEYADQIFAPHPLDGHYLEVDTAFDHDGTTSKVIVFPKDGRGVLYEWAI